MNETCKGFNVEFIGDAADFTSPLPKETEHRIIDDADRLASTVHDPELREFVRTRAESHLRNGYLRIFAVSQRTAEHK